MSTVTPTQVNPDQIIENIRQSQQTVVDAVRAWTEAAATATPSAPVLAPISPDAPDPRELVDSSFDFASKLLATQREFAQNLISASTPPSDEKAKAKKA